MVNAVYYAKRHTNSIPENLFFFLNIIQFSFTTTFYYNKSTNINNKSTNIYNKSTNIYNKSTNINNKSTNINNKSTNINLTHWTQRSDNNIWRWKSRSCQGFDKNGPLHNWISNGNTYTKICIDSLPIKKTTSYHKIEW